MYGKGWVSVCKNKRDGIKNDLALASMLCNTKEGIGRRLEYLVDANSLNMTGLLAFVADAFRSWLRRAIATQMTDLTT